MTFSDDQSQSATNGTTRQALPKVHLKTLGCKVNTYDGDAILTAFRERGYEPTDQPELADITILNSCSVTSAADRESRHLIRRYKRANPEGLVVATGCYAQTDSDALTQMPEVDLVIPNSHKQDIVALVNDHRTQHQGTSLPQAPRDPATKLPAGAQVVKANRQGHFKQALTLQPADPSRTRSFLKIQDGCNGFCTYCLIPYARGQSTSVKPQEVVTEVRRQIERGTQEIVLTGIHIGDFGKDDPENAASGSPLADLIAEMFSWPDMIRLRISSLEPMELTKEILVALATRPELFCNHFHMPLQSGHDRILGLMRRTYDTAGYASKVALAREYFPEAYFSADIIPGFPSETTEEALATEAFIERMGLNELHVFPYSPRPNTAAWRMPNKVDPSIIKDRAKSLRTLSDKLKHAYLKRAINTQSRILWEGKQTKSGQQVGRSLNYIEVVAPKSYRPEPGQVDAVTFRGFFDQERLLVQPLSAALAADQATDHRLSASLES